MGTLYAGAGAQYEAISLGKVLSAVGAVTGRKALRVPIPAGIARTAAAVMEFVSDHCYASPAGRNSGGSAHCVALSTAID